MRAQRLRTGLNRIGIVGAAVCGIVGAGLLGLSAYHFSQQQTVDASSLLGLGIAWLVGALAVYGICWAAGWIISGFAGDGDGKPSGGS
jgi:hypothetical protein